MVDINNAAWNESDGLNNSVPPAGFPEGMMPSGVNDASRAVMGAVKRWYNRISATLISGGSANAQTLTYSVAPTALAKGDTFSFVPGATNTGPATLNVGVGGNINIIGGNGLALTGAELTLGIPATVVYDGVSNFILLGGAGKFLPLTGGTLSGPLNITMGGFTASFTSREWDMGRDAGDDLNAGKINYRGFDPTALSVVGAGLVGSRRLVRIYDDLVVSNSVRLLGNYIYFGGADFGSTGPLYYADTINHSAVLGTGNGGFYWKKNDGTAVFHVDAAGNQFNLGSFLCLAGSTGTNGPLYYGDVNNLILRLGTGNNGAYFETSDGAIYATITPVDRGAITGSAQISPTRWRFRTNAGDDGSAGAIDYRGFDSGALSIVGAGTTPSNRAVRIFDNLTVPGSITSNGGITVTTPVAYRMTTNAAGTGYGSAWYNDGTATYLLLTNNNDALGSFNGLRPFEVNNASGAVSMSHGLRVTASSIFVLNSSGSNAFIAQNAGGSYVQIFDDGNSHIECSTQLWINSTSGAYTNFGGGVNVTGPISSNGANAILQFADRAGSSPTQWGWYATSGVARLYSNSGGDRIMVDGGGNTIFTNTIVVPNNTAVRGKDTGGAPRNLIFIGNDNNVWLGDGARVIFSTFSLFPANDNAWACGSGGGSSWASVSSYAYNTASDRKYKTDIEDLPDDCLELVERLNPQRYKLRSGDDRNTHWGFVAQDVGQVMAEAGHEFGGHQPNPDGESISYNELTAVLWKACQELTARVAQLEARA